MPRGMKPDAVPTDIVVVDAAWRVVKFGTCSEFAAVMARARALLNKQRRSVAK
jgi:hypothetical protein